ncbi:MAG: alanine--tRNA ligase [Bacteroidetes bacterium]|nr:alanine--tRNA ligase [Bacteroidota bacterium]MBU1679327.1 alanine--tRNA ligase [Bacteroidota bacterium]
MTSVEIRNQFLDFFRKKNHRIVDSAPVVPFDDPTLLFTNAGMNQFKDVFLGIGGRDYKRAADTQKCIRVSGKHNDLEEVGHDTYHHTFFEMLGNWSFGDYYKKEAIAWAWELLTDVWKLPKERLWATVYRADDEALECWKTETDINPDHILRFDEKDNFWEMGETGPCGPCSEIHINISDDYDNPKYVNAGDPKCIEIWNLVFIQYNRNENGVLHDLPAKHVDTGMGFERVCAVLQKKNSNYDTDVFMPIINVVEKLSGIEYAGDENMIAMRVIADHIRTLTFAIGDGATPGNEGRGYVLRRLLRRAARYGRKINLKEPFLFNLVDVVVKNFSQIFPEIINNQSNIKKIIKAEEESFNSTLDRGIELFDALVGKAKAENKKEISGGDVFKLYDTFGFPVDLTSVMAREIGLTIDEEKFSELMDEQKDRARKSTKEKVSSANAAKLLNSDSNLRETVFTGYSQLEVEAIIQSFAEGFIVFDRTPFYPESGGQIGDTGIIEHLGRTTPITDTIKVGNVIAHKYSGQLNIFPGEKVLLKVDSIRRWDIMRNHSVTHFLHKALREILGQHVQQSGSYVGPDYLRFDFTHFEKVKSEELSAIESLVNEKLRENLPLMHHRDTNFEDAKKMGALMFFGDKYGDKVNVVQFGDFTLEFCGGTHVQNSSQIGLFKITSESSIASGVRRIEAVTGAGVEKFIKNLESKIENSELRINELLDEKKRTEKELAGLKLKEKLGGIENVIANPIALSGINIFKGKVDASNMDELKSMGDELREKMKSGIGVLIAQIEEKVGIVTVVSEDLIKEKKISAGKIVGELAKIVGGGGGGRPHLATAGGKDIDKIDLVLGDVEKTVEQFL